MDETPLPPSPRPPKLPQPPPRQPLSSSPPTAFPYIQNHQPFTPPTTPTSSSSPNASLPKKRRSKLLQINTSHTAPPATSAVTTEIPPPPCTECGKTFPSKKALYGHMRCHPERTWRGINPPAAHIQQPPLPLTPPSTPITTDDREVAASLILLAKGAASPDVATASTATAYECSNCEKTFESRQALGGHRASHKNVKGCFAITKKSFTHDVEDGQCMIMQSGPNHKEGVGLGLSLGLGSGVGHKCWVCSKVFPTGQALGGHMRCHWERSEESSSLGLTIGSDSRTIKAQCGVDLNLPDQRLLLEDGKSPSVDSSTKMQLELRLGL